MENYNQKTEWKLDLELSAWLVLNPTVAIAQDLS